MAVSVSDKIVSLPAEHIASAPGLIVSFYSFTGGVGKSVFATNFAIEIAKMFPRKKTVLLDLSLYNPDIAIMLDIDVNRNRALKQYFVQDGFNISDLVHQYDKLKNLDVIVGDGNFTWLDQINAERLNKLLDELQRQYDYVIVDTNTAIDLVATYFPLRRSNKLVWVINPTIPSLKGADKEKIEQLRLVGVQGDICILVTRYKSVKEITTDVIRKETGIENVFSVYEQPEVFLDSINKGVPFAFLKGRYKGIRQMRKELQKMVSYVTDIDLDAIRVEE